MLRRLFRAVLKKITNKTSNGRRRPHRSNAEYHLTVAQMRRVIRAGKNFRDRVLVQMLAETGMRRTEVAHLQIEDVRFNDQLLNVRHAKGGKSRLVPMTPELTAGVGQLVAGRETGPVFKSQRGFQLSVRQLNRIVADAGKRARMRNPNPRQLNVTCHLFRHSFARMWKNKGGSMETLSRILGHESQKTTWDLYGTQSLRDVCRNYATIMRKVSAESNRSKTRRREDTPVAGHGMTNEEREE